MLSPFLRRKFLSFHKDVKRSKLFVGVYVLRGRHTCASHVAKTGWQWHQTPMLLIGARVQLDLLVGATLPLKKKRTQDT